MTKRIECLANSGKTGVAVHKDKGSSFDGHLACERIVNKRIADGDFEMSGFGMKER